MRDLSSRDELPASYLRWPFVVLVIVLLVAATTAAGLTVKSVRDGHTAQRQAVARAFASAESDLGSKDCASAQGHLRFVLSGAADPAVVARARALGATCRSVATLRTATAKAGRASNLVGIVTANLDFLRQRRPAGFAQQARDDVRDLLLDDTGPRAFTPAVCGRADEIVRDKILSTGAEDVLAPRFLASCAQTWLTHKDTAKAAQMTAKLRAVARGANAVTLAPPVKLVKAPPSSGKTFVVISNTAEEAAELVIVGERGPVFSYVKLPPCNNYTCKTGKGLGCQTDSTVIVILPPGKYHVLLRVSGSLAGSSKASWNLPDKALYAACLGL